MPGCLAGTLAMIPYFAVLFLAFVARCAVGCSRVVLRGLMITGAGVSGFISRQMEYHADTYQIAVAGSEGHESAHRHLAVLAVALDASYGSSEPPGI